MDNLFLNYPDLMNVEQVAEVFSIGRSTAYRLIYSKKLRYIKVGHQIRIPKAYLLEFIEKNAA